MKKLLLSFCMLLSALGSWAHDFVVNGIYYNITSSSDFTVAVTFQGREYNEYSNEYTGNVIIPETVSLSGKNYSVTSIGDYAFRGCSGLNSITIPSSVIEIGSYAFHGCRGLAKAEFASVESLCKITFGFGSLGNYANPLYYAHHLYINGEEVKDLVIPSSVTSIGSNVFSGCSALTSVTIPEGVTSIGSSAFSGCNGLTKAEFASVESLCGIVFGADANPLYYAHHLYINGEEVKDLVIPNSVTSIGSYVFSGCSALTSVTIPEGVTSIGGDAFSGCSKLTSITIPSSVTSIGGSAFINCNGLTKAEFASVESLCGIVFNDYANPLYYAHHLYINGEEVKDLVIPNSVTSIGSYVFSGCSALTSVTIGNSVTSIGGSVFAGCSGLTSVTIGNGVTSISQYAFSGCTGLTSVTIPNSVTSIGASAFNSCSGLTSVTIGNSVTSIGDKAFQNCSGLTSVTINSNAIASKTYTNSSTLANIFGSQVKNYIFGSQVWSIGDYACYKCSNLTSVSFGCNSVSTIGSYAFTGCTSLTKAEFASIKNLCGINFKDFGSNPLYYAKHLYINGEEITEVVIPNNVTEIGRYAFCNCSSLTSIVIPASVTSTGSDAFYGCSGIKSVTIYSSDVTGLSDCTGVETLKVGSKKIPSSVFGLAYIWSKNPTLKEVTILDGVKEIGADAFKDCTNLERCSFESVEGLLNIKFGNGYANPLCQNKVLNIGDKIVTELTIPESITDVKDYALFNCKSLKSVSEGENVKTIGVSAFSGNTKLNKVVLGSKVEKIGNYAFKQCPLTSIYSYAEVPPTCGNNVFSMNAEECKLYVPSTSISKYQNHQDWYEFDIQPMISTFKLTYMVDGEVYKTFTVDSGSTITAEPNPYKEGYTFSGWSEIPETMPANDVEITGTFTVNTYKVTFMYGDEVLKTIEVEYGAEIPLPESLDSERYTLVEWLDVPETMPAQDIIIRADFTDGIESIRNAQMHNEGIYDLNGRKLTRMQKGINIIRMKGGNTRKVLVK